MVLSSKAIDDNECGSNDNLLTAPTLAVTIYFKCLGHEIMYFPLFVSVSLPNEKLLEELSFVEKDICDRLCEKRAFGAGIEK